MGSKRFSAEVRERAVRIVLEKQTEHSSRWATVFRSRPRSAALAPHCIVGVTQAERDQGIRAGLSSGERESLKDLERENRELKRANEILRKASAFFAQAELDRKPKVMVAFIDAQRNVFGRVDLYAAADCPIHVLPDEGAAA